MFPPLRLAPLAVLAASLSCGEAGTEPAKEPFDPVGTISFSYQGGQTGTFSASGVLTVSPSLIPPPATGATGYRQDSVLTVVALRLANAGTAGDLFSMSLGAVRAPGSVFFGPTTCNLAAPTPCTLAVFVPGITVAELAGPFDAARLGDKAYLFLLGGVRITYLSGVRMRGTFEGSALRASDRSPTGMLTIRGGLFDLPIRPQAQ